MNQMTPRQLDILGLVRQSGRVEVDALAERFEVSPQTIRKDLNELCDMQLLDRVHGGAIFRSGVVNYAYDARRKVAADSKSRIGERAAALIPDNSSVLLNIGTTTEQVAHALRGHQGLLVITNNINVVTILRDNPGTEVIIAGGLVRQSDGGIVGDATVQFVHQFKADYSVIGVSAIDEDGSLLDYDYREVQVAQAIIANSRHPILVSDAMKFERTAPMRIGDVSQLRSFVTDRMPPTRFMSVCRKSGVGVEIAADPSADTGAEADAGRLEEADV
ncbi:MAG TPA: DeoR/GlpR family DNA-binding transcription regulator [Afifellaceae bacterium]|nr:DeoR/GlpR family DNA-binding transcription regulator [Afifellaceae bacterium]